MFRCPYCSKKCKSAKGLRCHINTTDCHKQELRKLQGRNAKQVPQKKEQATQLTSTRRHHARYDLAAPYDPGVSATQCKFILASSAPMADTQDSDEEDDDFSGLAGMSFEDEALLGDEAVEQHAAGPDTAILANFRDYSRHARSEFLDFHHEERYNIQLMSILRAGKCSLDMYDKLLAHIFERCGKVREHESASKHKDFISRHILLNKLENRYNLAGRVNLVEEITLPSSHAKAKIILNDARWCIESLLTDPRILSDDCRGIEWFRGIEC